MVIAIQIVGKKHETYDLTVDVVGPKNDVILTACSAAPKPLSDIGESFVPLTLTNTLFKVPGRYTIRITSAGRAVASKPLVLQDAVDLARAPQTHH